MKNFKGNGVVGVLAVVVVVAVLLGFTSTNGYQVGKQDIEYTMATVDGGKSITAGMVVVLKTTDTQGFDTGAVVTTIASEADTYVPYGVAAQSGSGGDIIRIITRGYTTVYVNGADTGASTAGVWQGDILTVSDVAGAVGGIGGDEGTAGYHQKVVGYAMATVASTDTGLYNKYGIYVDCR